MDGNHRVYDNKRGIYFSSVMDEVEVKMQWKEHVSDDTRSSNEHRNNNFYASYPRINYDVKNLPSEDEKLGNCQQLEQLIGIGMTKYNLTSIIELFA